MKTPRTMCAGNYFIFQIINFQMFSYILSTEKFVIDCRNALFTVLVFNADNNIELA